MKLRSSLPALVVIILLVGCGASGKLKLGECQLTITVKAEGDDFDGNANIYINSQFIGTTDARSSSLKLSLESGEYDVIVTYPQYEPWSSRITLLGGTLKQTVLARLKKYQ